MNASLFGTFAVVVQATRRAYVDYKAACIVLCRTFSPETRYDVVRVYKAHVVLVRVYDWPT